MAEEHDSAIDVAVRVAAAIEGVGGEYFLGGSLASSLQAKPRATNDIDIVVSMPLGRISEFCARLGSDFEVDVAMIKDALLHAKTANIFYLPLLTKIDLFGRGYEPFDESEFSRRSRVLVRTPDTYLVLKSPEDSILRKLWWYQIGGRSSERQWRDVLALLRVGQGHLEEGYLERWATHLGVVELLVRAHAEAGAFIVD